MMGEDQESALAASAPVCDATVVCSHEFIDAFMLSVLRFAFISITCVSRKVLHSFGCRRPPAGAGFSCWLI